MIKFAYFSAKQAGMKVSDESRFCFSLLFVFYPHFFEGQNKFEDKLRTKTLDGR
ncbi:hypothetical protein ABVF61_13225 [Roseibium sp. HPY-6]|uniref:hypothetical protein n=1 Tax=Roseibium sp. HPY-6 TaxID=3229852 RepID=UPI00338FC711